MAASELNPEFPHVNGGESFIWIKVGRPHFRKVLTAEQGKTASDQMVDQMSLSFVIEEHKVAHQRVMLRAPL
jgi:hypothetical protein